ncbi:MAG: HAMP domain-containing sensor histidine kinase [Eubacteriales bacterium]|nr:HAMP domain-containing sensor histidine kinase [Eubacteriales bacterium]
MKNTEKQPWTGHKRVKKPKKFHTLRSQIATVFIGLLLLSILSITAVNGLFLESYYVSKKTDVLLDAKEKLEELDIESLMEDTNNTSTHKFQDDIPDVLSIASSQNNLSWVIMDSNNYYQGWGEGKEMLATKLFGYIYDLDTDKNRSRVLKQTDGCVIQQVHDRFTGMDYVECWGSLEDEGYYFIIRTPFESIKESASISNGFYFYVGLFIICVSGLLIWIFTKRITKPISELTALSKRMSDLEFDARYQSRSGNEIDVLGDNFNRMSSQLEITISELKSANNELQKDIAAKIKIDEMRKEFLDNVSHELKTPIALVQGYAEGLKENISEDPESREFYCDVIMDEAAKMNKLVKNLLTLNQLESGKDAVVMERFDIVSLIRGVLQSMDIMIQQKEAKVLFEAQGPVYVWADEFKTEEVVTNYTSNALNHLDGQRQIEIKIIPDGDKVKVTVFNTGKTIPEEDLPNLWSKFYKVDKARTREYGGSGIGLSIVKAVMDGMNQQYGVQNYDNGVEFWFTLDRK